MKKGITSHPLITILIVVTILLFLVTVIKPIFSIDKSFSSFEEVKEYLKVNDSVYVTKTLDIEDFKFIAVASEDGYFFTSKTVYSKNNKFYLFDATVLNTIMIKSVLEHYIIEVYKINNHYVVTVHTDEFDLDGKPLFVNDNDGSDFLQLKITDRSVNYYRIYDDLPIDYMIIIENQTYKVN